jgi:hypothetical protein
LKQTDPYIIIKNIKGSVLEKILFEYADLESHLDYVKGIQMYRHKNNTDSFLILFINKPDFERFNYIVNYIRYPFNFENLKHFIRGFIYSADINNNFEFNIGGWLMVYISESDKDYDNVSICNHMNQSYILDFNEKFKNNGFPRRNI